MINIKYIVDNFIKSINYNDFIEKDTKKDTFYSFISDNSSYEDRLLDFKLNNSQLKITSYKDDTSIKPFYDYVKQNFTTPKIRKWKSVKQAFMEYLSKHILVCPYCWVTPLVYRINDKWRNVYSFELDHFLPKEYFPQFWLSLYNLIPSCKICNQTMKKWVPEWVVFHPYFWIIQIIIKNNKYSLKKINNNNLSNHINYNFWKQRWESDILIEHIKYFKLSEIYKTSITSKNDICFAKKVYDKLKFYNITINEKNISYFFNNWTYDNDTDLLKYSNWKFRKNVVEFIIKNYKL